jgi:hypothetical protein
VKAVPLPAIGDCVVRSTLHIAGDGLIHGKAMTQDDKGKGSSRQDRLKLALRENLKRRKSQARGRNDSAATSSADAKASLDDAGNEASE